jgi:hypothetical protein
VRTPASTRRWYETLRCASVLSPGRQSGVIALLWCRHRSQRYGRPRRAPSRAREAVVGDTRTLHSRRRSCRDHPTHRRRVGRRDQARTTRFPAAERRGLTHWLCGECDRSCRRLVRPRPSEGRDRGIVRGWTNHDRQLFKDSLLDILKNADEFDRRRSLRAPL